MLRLRQIFVLLEIHLTLGKRYLWHSGQIASHLSGVDKSHHVQPLEVVDVEDLQQPDRRTVLQTAAAASAGAAVASTPLAASAKAQRQWEPIDLSYLFDNLTSNAPIAGLPGASAKPILFDIEFDTKDPNHGFIIGNKGTFLETFDGGKKWKFRKFRQLDEDDEINYRFLQVSFKDGEGFIIGKPPILLYTQDEAKSWVRVPLSPKLPGDPTTIVCLGKGKAEMATSSGAVYSTENAGLNWKAEVKETIDATLNRVSSSGVQGASYFAGSIASIQRDTDFYPPTIISGVKEGVRIVDEEQFGPVLPVLTYSNENEVIDRANATNYGLGGSVWGPPEKAAEVAAKIDSGTVWVNAHGIVMPGIPFGGRKESGVGRQMGQGTIEGYMDTKIIRIPKQAQSRL